MSIHSSLRGVNDLTGRRSVLTREERIEKLKKDGKFDPSASSPYGLPKVRTQYKVVGAKKKKAAKPEGEGVPAEGAEAAAPAEAVPAAKSPKGAGRAKGEKGS